MKRILTIFFALFVAGSVWATEFVFEGIKYFILDSEKRTVQVISNDYSGNVIIPSSVTYKNYQYSVISIGTRAFSNSSATSVSIPNSVTSIGEYAFFYDQPLRTVIIPNSVTSIGEYAFCNCTWLTSVTIPNSVAKIEPCTFADCERLTSVIISNGVTSIGGSAFSRCTSLTSITIPNSVTEIGGSAFSRCTSLTSVTIPEGVTSIAPYTFIRCSSLTSINILNRVTSIGENAFSGCENISLVIIPNSVTEIGENAFGCSDTYEGFLNGVDTILYSGNAEGSPWGAKNVIDAIDENYVYNNEQKTIIYKFIGNGTDVVIPSSVTTIAAGAFSGCSNIKSVTIPSSVTKVEDGAFSGCTALKNVTCLATVPPTAYANSFENYNGYLSIPCESKDDYDFALCWGSFKHVDCIGSETVELTKDEVAVVPEKTEAVFSMPKNENANTYTLTISNNGVTFCSLTFNAQGQLANIDFSTNKSYELKSGVEAFQFTVTGLSTAEDYGYSFKALASNKSVLKEYSGSFTTKNEDGTGGSVQGGGEGSGQGGQGGSTAVSEVSNTTAVTVVNGQILVNGEAPAFVVTVSGQKIVNANLKAGVYFVVADGNSMSVVVR
ncbi:MAG: leucine-rich repeat domain-containing protein [Bacteroidales bacterium]|nr:leucine-rich repeat domain-containing protein [Bacteroidales bacterium]